MKSRLRHLSVPKWNRRAGGVVRPSRSGKYEGSIDGDHSTADEFSDPVTQVATFMRDLRDKENEERYASILGVTKREVMLWERGYLIPEKSIVERALRLSGMHDYSEWGHASSLDLISSVVERAKKRELDRSLILEPVSSTLLEELNRRPGLLYALKPEVFEEVVAEILSDIGANVSLTPRGKDGGRDVLAVFSTPLGNILTLVQCKRYSPDRKIGRPILAEFLYTIRDQDRANMGLVVTTSYFSRDASLLANDNHWLLKLADFDRIKEWLADYGNWEKISGSLFWKPK